MLLVLLLDCLECHFLCSYMASEEHPLGVKQACLSCLPSYIGCPLKLGAARRWDWRWSFGLELEDQGLPTFAPLNFSAWWTHGKYSTFSDLRLFTFNYFVLCFKHWYVSQRLTCWGSVPGAAVCREWCWWHACEGSASGLEKPPGADRRATAEQVHRGHLCVVCTFGVEWSC